MKTRKDNALAIVRALAATPNGAPLHYLELPLQDPGDSTVAYQEGRQCLLCYRSVAGKQVRHLDTCPYLRARRLLKPKAARKGRGK